MTRPISTPARNTSSICPAKKLSRSKSKPNFVSPASASPESLSRMRG
jgi:hypothetical protein